MKLKVYYAELLPGSLLITKDKKLLVQPMQAAFRN